MSQQSDANNSEIRGLHRPRPSRPPPRRARRAAAIVEMALIMPLSLLLTIAAVDLSWLHILRHTADVAAYEAAKSGFVPGASDESIAAEASSRLELFRVRNPHVEVTAERLGPTADSVTVTITVPLSNNTWAFAATQGKSIVAEHTMHQRHHN